MSSAAPPPRLESPPGVALRRIDYPPHLRQPAHEHATASVTVILEGSLVETARGTERRARRGSVVYKPAGERHADLFGPEGTATLQIALGPGRDVPRYDWRDGGLASALGLALGAAVAIGDDAARLDAECLVGALLGLSSEPVPPAARPPWLATVIDFLDAHASEPLHAADLSHLAPVHPVHLARVFRRHHGCSIGEYLRRKRLEAAAAALASEGASIAGIAFAAGFSDQAHFTRAFRAHAGLPPGRFRRLAAGAR